MIIPSNRRYYLREIVDTVRDYHKRAEEQVNLARQLFQIEGLIAIAKKRENLSRSFKPSKN